MTPLLLLLPRWPLLLLLLVLPGVPGEGGSSPVAVEGEGVGVDGKKACSSASRTMAERPKSAIFSTSPSSSASSRFSGF